MYDNEADNSVFSVASISETEVYAGTLHRFIKVIEENEIWTAEPEKDVMFKADLRSVWTNSSHSENSYTLNKKTGAIFQLELDFTDFTPENPNPVIQLSEDDIVANISGADGEFDGLAIAGYGNNIIVSSKNDSGEGKLIRSDGGNWPEVTIAGNPVFEASAMDDTYSYGVFGGSPNNVYRGDATGNNWINLLHTVQTNKVNDLSAFDTGGGNFVVILSGEAIVSEDHLIAYSMNSGESWSYSESGLGSVSRVYRVESLAEQGGAGYYAATNKGIYKTNDLNGTWVRKDNQLPPGTNVITDILVESGEYTLFPSPPSNNYLDGFVVQAIVDNGTADRFFISADSARSWNEDSSFPEDVDIKRLWNYDYPGVGGVQTGIVAATNKGLFYHPHNVINGMYTGGSPSVCFDDYWGPGLILVNGQVIVRLNVEDPFNPEFSHARLNILANTTVKFTYNFKTGIGSDPSLEVNDSLRTVGPGPGSEIVFESSRSSGLAGDWGGVFSRRYYPPGYDLKMYPSTSLNYCLIENAVFGVMSFGSDEITVSKSRVINNDFSGIYCKNTEIPSGDIVFNIDIVDCEVDNNPEYGVYIQGTVGWVDCSEPWDGNSPPANPDDIWDPKYPDPKDPKNYRVVISIGQGLLSIKIL